MKLTTLYKLRHNFVVIGLTGRSGSGCTKIAEILSSDLDKLLEGVRDPKEVTNPILSRKLEICKNFLSYEENWKPFEVIRYKDVLLFYLISYVGNDINKLKSLLKEFYREGKDEDNNELTEKLSQEISHNLKGKQILKEIVRINANIKQIKDTDKLKQLNSLFFGEEFKKISREVSGILERNDYYKRTLFLHFVSCNIRQSGDPLNAGKTSDISSIYTIAELINRLIKARKVYNDSINKPTKIIIDSLRNSLEIMFFKERYSAFYMMATKEGQNRNKERIKDRLPSDLTKLEKDKIADDLMRLDVTEYKTNDYNKGIFSSPDVNNCIQKSEIHLVNNSPEKNLGINDFFSVEEQLLKIISLIQQPGIITPSQSERCMQIAYNVKLNSGCISRQVGAVITDESYSVKSVGWNDVPKGQTPCILRNADDFNSSHTTSLHYSNFERGQGIESNDVDFKYKNKAPKTFPEALKSYYNGKDISINNTELEGKNCSFCFKTIHNFYEGERNQVHTKSLHAEENAMLQLTKHGSPGLKEGILFTTASPCELCSKKAMQLGVSKIYYIDPYPGISEPQILTFNRNYSIQLVTFSGVIGKAYNKLYEPFMAYKDELEIIIDNKPIVHDKNSKFLIMINSLSNEQLKSKMLNYIKEDVLDEDSLLNHLSD